MNWHQIGFFTILVSIVLLQYFPSTTESSTGSKDKFNKRDRADWLPVNILANHIEGRKRKDPAAQGDKQKPGLSHGSGNSGCTGRNCEKPSKPCTGKNCGNQGGMQAKCGTNPCRTDQECIRRTRGKCSFCVSRRCTSRKPYKNVEKEKPTQSNARKFTGNVRRFTRVARIYTWRAGRPRETRPQRFAQCKMKRCTKDSQCQQINRHRLKRTPNQCRFCGYNLAWNKKTCGHFKEGSDRWIPNILKEEKYGEGKLTIPDFTEEPGGDYTPAGQLHYERDQDPNGRNFMRFSYIEVKEKYQNRSMGRALVRKFIEDVVMRDHRDLNLIKLEVGDHENNGQAKRLYERFGFRHDPLAGQTWEYHMDLDVRRYKPVAPVDVPREKKL